MGQEPVEDAKIVVVSNLVFEEDAKDEGYELSVRCDVLKLFFHAVKVFLK